MKKLISGLLFSVGLAIAAAAWGQSYFNIFGPAAGIQKNTGATPFNTAAVSADIYGLWTGTCSASTFLRGDGACATPAGTGVSSVTVPAPLTATGCSGGACAITWTTGQTANQVLASPNGSTGAVSLRALVGADIAPINLASTVNGGVLNSSILPGANGGTANGFFAVSGPATSLKTFTFPNASATVLTSNAAVTVAQGGTSLATLTANGVMLGEGTSAPNFVVMGADTVLRGTASADPVATSVNNCGSGTQALSYSTSTHTFGCQTISVGTGTVTSISAGTGITESPSPITTTGTVSVDQTFSPTWTGTHLFEGTTSAAVGASMVSAGVSGSTSVITMVDSAAAANTKMWQLVTGVNSLVGQVANDANSTTSTWLNVGRSAATIASIAFGNSTDKPTVTINGPVIVPAPSSGAALQLNAASSTGTMTVDSSNYAWANKGAIDLGTTGGLESDTGGNMYVAENAFWNGSSWTYKTTAAATVIQETNGSINFTTASSGTAGTTTAMTLAMSISNDRGVEIGSPQPTDEGAGTLNVLNGYYYNNIKIPRTVTMQAACTSGGCTATQEFGISTTVTRNSAGNYTVTYSNAFGTAPVCVASPAPTSAGTTTAIMSTVSTTTAIIQTFTSSSGSSADSGFAVICAGL